MRDPMEDSELPDSLKYAIEWCINWRRRLKSRRRKVHLTRVRDAAIASILDLMENSGTVVRTVRPTCNICLYVLLIDQDLSELMNDMVHAIGPHRRKHIARQLAVLLWEATDDLTQLLSTNYRRSLEKFELPAEWMEEFNLSVSRLGAFKRANRDVLSNIRNMVAAHREKDAITQYHTMCDIDALDVTRLGPQFQAAVDPLIPLMIKIMSHSKTFHVAGEDYLRSFGVLVNEE